MLDAKSDKSPLAPVPHGLKAPASRIAVGGAAVLACLTWSLACQKDTIDKPAPAGQSTNSDGSPQDNNTPQGDDQSLNSTERGQWWNDTSTKAFSAGDSSEVQAAIPRDPYTGCGYDPTAGASSFTNSSFNSTPTVMTGSNYRMNGNATLAVNASTAGASMAMDFNIVSGSPSNAVGRAKQAAVHYSNTTTTTNVANAEALAALGRSKDTTTCGILMTRTLKVNSKDGNSHITITFDKPYPYMLSPTLTKERLAYELRTKIVTQTITATLDSNDAQVMKGGATHTGTVQIFAVDHTQPITDTNNVATTFGADYAYRVASKFDSSNGGASNIGWLDQATDYYVKAGALVGVVIRLPRKDMPIIVYKK